MGGLGTRLSVIVECISCHHLFIFIHCLHHSQSKTPSLKKLAKEVLGLDIHRSQHDSVRLASFPGSTPQLSSYSVNISCMQGDSPLFVLRATKAGVEARNEATCTV